MADEYGIRQWIEALLDPEPITHGTSDSTKAITSPPTYKFKDMPNGAGKTPAKKAASRKSVRGEKDAPPASPTKKTPARKTATPRRPRKSRGKSAEPEAVLNGETAKVEVEAESKPSLIGGEEVEITKINIDMPAGSSVAGASKDGPAMLEKAREMVEEAAKVSGRGTGKGKRKARELADDDEEGAASPASDSKRVKTVALELRRERIKRRALTGIAASLAIGYVFLHLGCR